jgi:hypothetical protein
MPKLVGFIFGAIAGLVAAAWFYGGSTWGPGFAAKEAVTLGIGAPQFKLSSEPPAANPTGETAAAASAAPPRPASGASPPASAETTNGAAPPPFNTGGNPNVEIGAGPNWGLGYGVGRTGK